MRYGLIFLLTLLAGCTSRRSSSLEELHQRIAKHLEVLIDSDSIQTPYVEIQKVSSNDSSVIYRIRASTSAGSYSQELPSQVIKYKDRYLCFTELDEPEMSRTELFEKGIVSDSNFHENALTMEVGFWLLGLRRYVDNHVLLKGSSDCNIYITEYPELWSYFSGGSPEGKPVLMVLESHHIAVPDSCLSELHDLDVDSLKNYIVRFYGGIVFNNLTDSTIVLSNNSMRDAAFAVINGSDTLRLILRESLPITIEPHGYGYLRYDSESPHRFLRKLPDEDAWMSMFKLFCDSTFCFLKINGIPTDYRIMHNDTRVCSDMTTDSISRDNMARGSRTFYNKGYYDIDERIHNFHGW